MSFLIRKKLNEDELLISFLTQNSGGFQPSPGICPFSIRQSRGNAIVHPNRDLFASPPLNTTHVFTTNIDHVFTTFSKPISQKRFYHNSKGVQVGRKGEASQPMRWLKTRSQNRAISSEMPTPTPTQLSTRRSVSERKAGPWSRALPMLAKPSNPPRNERGSAQETSHLARRQFLRQSRSISVSRVSGYLSFVDKRPRIVRQGACIFEGVLLIEACDSIEAGMRDWRTPFAKPRMLIPPPTALSESVVVVPLA